MDITKKIIFVWPLEGAMHLCKTTETTSSKQYDIFITQSHKGHGYILYRHTIWSRTLCIHITIIL